MKLFFSICIILFFSIFSSFSQLTSGKLLVLNEGSNAQKGSIGYIDYTTNAYTHIDSIARFGNQIVAHNGLLYAIDGDGNIHIYDIANNYSPISLIDSVYARGLDFWGDKMVVTTTVAPFFQVFEKTAPFNFLYGLGTNLVRSEREEVIVIGQQAYLSGFYGDSVVYAVDLSNSTTTMIVTPPNPYQIEEINGQIYAACFTYNPDFTTNTVISRINTTTNQIDASFYMPYASGFTSSNTHIYQMKSNGKVITIDAALQVVDTTSAQGFFYGFQYDKLSDNLFYSETDFISTGAVGYIQGTTLYPTINTSLSPRTFYFMSNPGVAVENSDLNASLSVYPNPAQDVLYLQNLNTGIQFTYTISDMTGKILIEAEENQPEIIVSSLPQGVYFLSIKTEKRNAFISKWVKL